MFRYFAFAWNEHSSHASASAHLLERRWRESARAFAPCFSAGGLTVYISHGPQARCVHHLADGQGVIVGSLFDRSHEENATRTCGPLLSEFQSTRIVRTGGRRLIEAYWGSYVAFLVSRTNQKKWVLLSPMASLPCFERVSEEVTVYFSRMEDSLGLALPHAINWNYVAAHLVIGGVSGHQTALTEVSEIKAGECIERHGSQTLRHLYWNPGTIAGSNLIEDFDEAARAVRGSAESCTRALASKHEEILLHLSGGLDSSAVLGCVRAALKQPRITCVNLYAEGASSDERPYAALAARQAGCELVEVSRPWQIDLRRAWEAARTAVIYEYAMRLEHADMHAQVIRNRAATALFTGNGGDEIFQRAPLQPAVMDFCRLHGLHPRLLSVALAVARLQRISLWRVLKDLSAEWGTSADRFHRKRVLSWIEHAGRLGFVQEDLLRSFGDNPNGRHPWLRFLKAVPPGKFFQIMALSGKCYDNPFARSGDPEVVNPLLSQPLVEICLRIPTHVHIHRAISRAVARRAFEGLVPEEILNRTTKGGVEQHLKRILTHNIEFIREVVLDGVLVKQRMIKRAALEEVLSLRPSKSTALLEDTVHFFSTELWLKKWDARPVQPVAA
jgi:asparagine synthase (glutamine-hydrolysing)